MDSAVVLRLDSDTLRNFNRLATIDRKFVEDGALVTFTSTIVNLAEQFAIERARLEDSGEFIGDSDIIAVRCDRVAAARFVRGGVLLSFHIAQGYCPAVPPEEFTKFSNIIMDVSKSFNEKFAKDQMGVMVTFAAEMIEKGIKYNTVDILTLGENSGISLN